MQLEDFFSSITSRPGLRTWKEIIDKLDKLRAYTGVNDLDQEYHQIYQRNTLPDRESRAHANRAYKILFCCLQPLNLNQLAQATSVEEDGNTHPEVSGAYILDICSNFISAIHGVVQFAHSSARDYLESRKMCEFSAEKQHVQLALTSLHVSRSSCGQLLRYIGERIFKSQQVIERLLPAKLHFIIYAAKSWPYHASKVSVVARVREGITTQITLFLSSTTFQDWHMLMSRILRGFYTQIDDSLVSSHDPPNPIFLISAFGFVECIEVPKVAKRIPGHAKTRTIKTPLHVACYYDHAGIVERFLTDFRANFDLDARDLYDDTPLRSTVLSGSISVKSVSLLLKHGAIRKEPIVEGSKTMHLGVACQRLDMVQFLMQHVKKVYSSHQILMMMTQAEWGILDLAVGVGSRPILEFLLSKIDAMLADKELRNRVGYLLGKVALRAAASAGSSNSLRLIMKSSVPIYVRGLKDVQHCTMLERPASWNALSVQIHRCSRHETYMG
jgi:Ankyrin repeat